MYVVADIGLGCYHAQCLVAHVLGMAGGEAHAHLRHSPCHGLKQLGESGFMSLVIHCAVTVDILSQQCHLLEPTVAQVTAFAQNALHITAALASTGIGYDAVVAEVVASAHDADEPPDVYSADALRHDVAIGLGERELHVDGLLPALHLRHHIGKRHIGVGAHHQVGVILLDELFLDALGHASQHSDDDTASLLLQTVKELQAAQNLLLGIVPHRACI